MPDDLAPTAGRPLADRSGSHFADQEIDGFCEFLWRRTGIRLVASRRHFIESRLAQRMQACGITRPADYLALLRAAPSGPEVQALINEMTVNETYFFREDYQFECLVRHLLDAATEGRRPGDRIRIWSLPCSTGEEPYSIAIWILEKWGRADEFDIEIHASDIDSRVLARSQEGIYEARALHRVDARLRDTYFDAAGEGRWRIREEIRRSIEFTAINIFDPAQMSRMRGFDVIFCRNLLIYFDELSRRRAAEHLYDALVPGGHLCLGHSESMSRISSLFVPRKYPEAIVYQKARP